MTPHDPQLRDAIAMMAMNAMLSIPANATMAMKQLADRSYGIADAMLKARDE